MIIYWVGNANICSRCIREDETHNKSVIAFRDTCSRCFVTFGE